MVENTHIIVRIGLGRIPKDQQLHNSKQNRQPRRQQRMNAKPLLQQLLLLLNRQRVRVQGIGDVQSPRPRERVPHHIAEALYTTRHRLRGGSLLREVGAVAYAVSQEDECDGEGQRVVALLLLLLSQDVQEGHAPQTAQREDRGGDCQCLQELHVARVRTRHRAAPRN